MDALRKQASRLKEQVSKQQQAVIKQFSASGYESSDVVVIDEVEMQMHHHLEKLYRSTRSGRDFQKDLVKAAETFTGIGYKHIEAGTKLSEDCCKYGVENVNDEVLSKAASIYGDARKHVEKEVEDLNRVLLNQVLEPLRAMIIGSPLEDARHLAQRYSRMRQEAETQAVEVSRRQARVREAPIPENVAKLHAAEAKMQELRANMAVLGKEAAAALSAVESQQQRLTFQRLVAMVEGERQYHERVAVILGNIEAEMVSEKQRKEATPPIAVPPATPIVHSSEKTKYFLAEKALGASWAPRQPSNPSISPPLFPFRTAMHSFEAETEKELSLSKGDFVVVRKVAPSGWWEGECQGRAGWFPSTYVEKRQRVPNNYTAAEVY